MILAIISVLRRTKYLNMKNSVGDWIFQSILQFTELRGKKTRPRFLYGKPGPSVSLMEKGDPNS